MKKYPSILIAAVMAAGVTTTFGQGTVVFNNGTGLVQRWAGDGTVISMPKYGGFVQLFWAPTGTGYTPWNPRLSGAQWYAANPGWVLQNPFAPTGFTTPYAGRFDGGTFTLQPLAPGATIDYVVIGWTGTAVSFDAALAANDAVVGVSAKFTSATGSPPGTAVPLASSFGGLTLTPAPEPSSLALAGLGAATLLALRRRE